MNRSLRRKIHLSTLGAGLLLLLLSSPALAFKPEGHEDLESVAYKELNSAATVSVPGETFSGHEVLEELRRARVLRASPDDGLPPAGSAGPDHAFERQFDTRNQGFHFMAENDDVLAATNESDPEQALLVLALPKNLRLMRLLFDETVENPVGAFQAGRGVYVLLHIVGDSFSREHVTRDESNRLVTIKGWRLLSPSWPPAATRANGMSHDETALLALLHHAFAGGADYDWREKSPCNPLTAEGRQAVDAMKSLLATVYAARKAYSAGPETDKARRDQLWAAFVEEHFNNASCPLKDGQWTCASPNPLAAVSLRKRMRLIDADAFPSWQLSLGAGARFSHEPDVPFGQLVIERHVVPYRAIGFFPRVRPGGALVLRTPLSDRLVTGGERRWYSGTEGTLQGGFSTMFPWVQWLGVYAGAGVRGGPKSEPGVAMSLTWNLYFRRYVALTARYEHDWWRDSGHANNLGLGISFFLVHAREVKDVCYKDDEYRPAAGTRCHSQP